MEELLDGRMDDKPILLYLPGFDGTWMAPFLQFPELGTVFDLRCMTISMEDRSTYEELKQIVLRYIVEETNQRDDTEVEEEEEDDDDEEDTVSEKDSVKDTPLDESDQSAGTETIDVQKSTPKKQVGGNSFWNPFRGKADANQQNENGDKKSQDASSTKKNQKRTRQRRGKGTRRPPPPRPVYLCGESFGGILASDVALTILEEQRKPKQRREREQDASDNLGQVSLKGLVVVNAATCYDRSKLAAEGPVVANSNDWLYPVNLGRLLPLFRDKYSVDQLLLILTAQGLPSVIDSAPREAYMGRVAFSIPNKLRYMPRSTLSWRLHEWLDKGCTVMESRLGGFSRERGFRALIVAGEDDLCLPSIDEARRLSGSIFRDNIVHVVEGAGHGSTCGSRVDLAALMRNRFPELRKDKTDRTAMKVGAAQGEGVLLGMEPRYDGRKDIGLLPWKYWSRTLYTRPPPEFRTSKPQSREG